MFVFHCVHVGNKLGVYKHMSNIPFRTNVDCVRGLQRHEHRHERPRTCHADWRADSPSVRRRRTPRDCADGNIDVDLNVRDQTPYGRGISIEDVEVLHMAIAHALVEEKPSLSGPEVRFIRKLLELTQTQLAALLGVEDQSVRRWEKLARVPKQSGCNGRSFRAALRPPPSLRPVLRRPG